MTRLTQSVGFHTWSRVDCITEETIAGHLEADHAGHARSRVQSDAQFQLVAGTVAHTESGDGLQQTQRHASDFPRVGVAVAHRQSRHHHVSVADGFHLWQVYKKLYSPHSLQSFNDMNKRSFERFFFFFFWNRWNRAAVHVRFFSVWIKDVCRSLVTLVGAFSSCFFFSLWIDRRS